MMRGLRLRRLRRRRRIGDRILDGLKSALQMENWYTICLLACWVRVLTVSRGLGSGGSPAVPRNALEVGTLSACCEAA